MFRNKNMLLREILGLFFLGILLSGIFYFWFQNSLNPNLDTLEAKFHTISNEKEQAMWIYLLLIVLERLKPFVLIWIIAQTKWKHIFLVFFLVWTGGNFGFLHAFLVHYYGLFGLWRGFLYQFPQMFFYIPAYLIVFIIIEKGEPKNLHRMFLLSLFLCILGCVMETYIGIPILRNLYY